MDAKAQFHDFEIGDVHNVRQDLGKKSDDEIADWMASISAGSNNEMTARAEFLRRQTALQRESTQATVNAAQASQDTSKYTRRNAKYMLWSVIFLAVSAFGTPILSNYLTRRDEHHRDARTCDELMSSLLSMVISAGDTAKAASLSVRTRIPPTQKSNKFVFPPIDEVLSAQDSLLGIIDATSRNSVLEVQEYYRSIRDDLSNTPGVDQSGETYGVEPASGNIVFYKNLLKHMADRATAAATVLHNSTYCKQLARTNLW